MGLMSLPRRSLMSKGKNEEFRIFALGLDNAGKTTISKQFVGQEIVHIMLTQVRILSS